jgi:hypothetical protein
LIHGGPPQAGASVAEQSPLFTEALAAGMPGLRDLLEVMAKEHRELQRQMEELYQSMSPPGPRMLIDILFPPFKTTIDDPAYPEPRTIVGPWYD